EHPPGRLDCVHRRGRPLRRQLAALLRDVPLPRRRVDAAAARPPPAASLARRGTAGIKPVTIVDPMDTGPLVETSPIVLPRRRERTDRGQGSSVAPLLFGWMLLDDHDVFAGAGGRSRTVEPGRSGDHRPGPAALEPGADAPGRARAAPLRRGALGPGCA